VTPFPLPVLRWLSACLLALCLGGSFRAAGTLSFTNLWAYDDANRAVTLTYPNGGPVVTNTFDTGLNLATVSRVVGGSPQSLSTGIGFNEVGQLTGLNFGNGVRTTNEYHPRSRRLKSIVTFKVGSTNVQSLAYTYDAVANVKSITDTVHAPSHRTPCWCSTPGTSSRRRHSTSSNSTTPSNA